MADYHKSALAMKKSTPLFNTSVKEGHLLKPGKNASLLHNIKCIATLLDR